MTVEERIEAADRSKIESNYYFKEKKFEEAMQQYEMVRDLLYLEIFNIFLKRVMFENQAIVSTTLTNFETIMFLEFYDRNHFLKS